MKFINVPILRSATARGHEESENPIFYIFPSGFPKKVKFSSRFFGAFPMPTNIAASTTRRSDTLRTAHWTHN
jgi:hypothetical protein